MNKTELYEFCIIVPIYNEEDNMLRLEKELADYLKTASVKACALFVNDGSKDDSQRLIEDVCARNKSFYYISFAQNRGLSAAIKAGIDVAQSPYVGYIDADLQTTPQDFELLLPHRKDYELVLGIRSGRKDSFVKNLSSKIANGFRRMMTKDGVEDTGCPLKVIRTDYAKRIPFFTGMHRFLPALIQLQNGRVKQLPVRHFERMAGQSKFHLWNRLTGPFMDCFAYRWMKKRYINYTIAADNITPNKDTNVG
ncbi:dolichol-phosphate mannosyltransferase [Dysgonomonas sp. PH5-45]|uniref:glycosyltransferase family 2 protein n=1 Tax=unclassified Dysgonomonas TaxID=2630389 RepID=UPI002475A767|nr:MULTISPECIES: glycosyltransferase family 2 protein [unclassified Dysgonomonas]MDH6353973.1 dolichol-phosphate mannosyltransferase [Dysgonomonas sp. PH5-45]MDH6386875.1 dolichol-phosphate mannosyltransferase [Dysgonomonas sp. PH5-37]